MYLINLLEKEKTGKSTIGNKCKNLKPRHLIPPQGNPQRMRR